MLSTNKLMLDIGANRPLNDYLATKGPGDTCVFELTVQLDEKTFDQAVFSVKNVSVDDDEAEDIAEQNANGDALPGDDGKEGGMSAMEGGGGNSGNPGDSGRSEPPKNPAVVLSLFKKNKK